MDMTRGGSVQGEYLGIDELEELEKECREVQKSGLKEGRSGKIEDSVKYSVLSLPLGTAEDMCVICF